MSRIITKPEDAVPKAEIVGHIETELLSMDIGCKTQPFFTAAECAQIAKAYAEAVLNMKKYRKVDISANQEPYPDDAWRAKFKQWENES